jgi:hypothetical protein
MAVGYRHDLRALAALCLSHACSALLGRRETAVNESFPQVKEAFVVECPARTSSTSFKTPD